MIYANTLLALYVLAISASAQSTSTSMTTIRAPGGCGAPSNSVEPNSPISLPTSGPGTATSLPSNPPTVTSIPVPASSTTTIASPASSCSNIPYSGTSVPPDPSLDFATGMLGRHNYLRQFHGASSPMSWSDALAAAAQAEVNTCIFQHTANNPYGENLAGISRTSGYTANQLVVAVDEWYAEIAAYNFSQPGFSTSTGHFTQLVWLASNTLGCAWKDCTATPLGLYFVACEYAPQGNIANPGYFQANVLPPVSSVNSCAAGSVMGPGKRLKKWLGMGDGQMMDKQPGWYRGRRMAREVPAF